MGKKFYIYSFNSNLLAQFCAYTMAKNSLARLTNKTVDNLSIASLMISGSIGGFACWFFSYPQDSIKTIL